MVRSAPNAMSKTARSCCTRNRVVLQQRPAILPWLSSLSVGTIICP